MRGVKVFMMKMIIMIIPLPTRQMEKKHTLEPVFAEQLQAQITHGLATVAVFAENLILIRICIHQTMIPIQELVPAEILLVLYTFGITADVPSAEGYIRIRIPIPQRRQSTLEPVLAE